jgi:hypothetical protein
MWFQVWQLYASRISRSQLLFAFTPTSSPRVDIWHSASFILPSTMETVQGALEAIKKAALNDKVDKEIKDTVNHVSSSLVLLVSQSLRVQITNY